MDFILYSFGSDSVTWIRYHVGLFLFQVVILDYKSIICPGKSFVLHLQAIIEEVTLKALICLIDRKTGEKSKQRPR